MAVHRPTRRSYKKGSGLPYRRLTGAVLAALACAAPGVAQAHGGPVYQAGEVTGPAPTIDGVVTASEWDDSVPYGLAFGSLGNATLRFVHTPTHLYVAAVVQDSSSGLTPSFDVAFDNDHDGVGELGDDLWDSDDGDFFLNPDRARRCRLLQRLVRRRHVGDRGRIDDLRQQRHVRGEAPAVHGHVPRPLHVGGEHARDRLPVRAKRCRRVRALARARTCSTRAPTGPTSRSSRETSSRRRSASRRPRRAPSSAARSTSPPTSRTTSASTASSSATTAGRSSFVDIATDTTPPYEATFDSTQVPNTIRGGGTVYAFAFDAAENETAVGNAVMVDNPASRIVFETNRDFGNSEIYSMEPNGNDPITRLTNESGGRRHGPSLSPDGSLIAWQRGDQIWLMNSDGTEPHALTSVTAGTQRRRSRRTARRSHSRADPPRT